MNCTIRTDSIEQLLMAEEPCRLLQLPDEVKLEIVKHLHRRRDLYNFSLACRSLEDITLSRLYKSIDLDLPKSDCPNWNHDSLPTFRPYVLQNMRELVIRNGVSDVENPVYHKRRRSDANSMEGYVGQIFRGVPQDRLKAFSFLHQTPMSFQMLDGLTRQHGGGLKHLQCCELELLNKSEASFPSNLRSLECRSVLSGEAVTKLIAANKNTLRTLSLGQDKYLLQQYHQRRIGFLENVPQPFEHFHTTLDLTTIPNLRSLSFSGLDLAPLAPQNIESALCLSQLESLTLETCGNTAQFLDVLSSTFTHLKTSRKQSPSLKKLSLRHEFFTIPLKDSLLRFLSSFTGLEHLSVLIENTAVTTRLSTFVQNHAATLKTLVLETRIQPREHLHIDTSRPLGTGASQSQLWQDTLYDICTMCPNLVELGMAIPWDDEEVQPHFNRLNALKHLKTLHIRNFPPSQAHSQLGETMMQEYASKFLSWAYPCAITSTSSSLSSTLETLAIGPTLYSSRWQLGDQSSGTQTSQPRIHPVHTSQLHGSTAPRRLEPLVTGTAKKNDGSPPEYLRTHYFSVGDCGMAKAVSERYMEEMRGQRGLGGVFDGVWLR